MCLICSLFQNISPISRKLGENVITNCAATLEPYLMEAVKSLGINVDDYAEIVASICQNGKQDLKHKSANDVKDNLVGSCLVIRKIYQLVWHATSFSHYIFICIGKTIQ